MENDHVNTSVVIQKDGDLWIKIALFGALIFASIFAGRR